MISRLITLSLTVGLFGAVIGGALAMRAANWQEATAHFTVAILLTLHLPSGKNR